MPQKWAYQKWNHSESKYQEGQLSQALDAV
jgi:hypothetical protein